MAGLIEIAPTACGACGATGSTCMRRLNRTAALGKGKKQGVGGKACCDACADGNTHPPVSSWPETCADWGKVYGAKTQG